MGAMASQMTGLSIVYSSVCSGADKKKAPRHWPLWGEFTGDRWIPSQIKGQVTRKMFPFDDVIMIIYFPSAG